MDISNLRQEYRKKSLDFKDLDLNPFIQFDAWFQEAIHAEIFEPHATALATVNEEGKPCCRMVLIKQWNEEGFVFFTNL